MSATPVADAELAVIRALMATVSGAAIESGANKIGRKLVEVGSDGSQWTPHRDLVTVTAEVYAAGNRPSVREAGAIDMVDQVLRGFQTVDGTAVYWAGPGTDLDSTEIDDTTIDGTDYGTATVSGTIVVERPGRYGDRGPAEQIVYDVLNAAGLPVTDTADRGQFVVCRWTGSAPDDPWYEQVGVWCAAPAETGQVETLARRAWNALYASTQLVVSTDVSLDLAGTPPGSVLSHGTAQMMCRILVPTRANS